MKINLGCGANRMDGWLNHDADVDITERLPWGNGEAKFVFAEHVVEHVTYDQAIAFFRECRRILVSGGVCRIAVPSVEQIWRNATDEYMEFTRKWVDPTPNEAPRRDAMTNILYRHGHRAPWTQGLLLATMYYAGFDRVAACDPGLSNHQELRGVEGHGRVIGDAFNAIETVVCEAS